MTDFNSLRREEKLNDLVVRLLLGKDTLGLPVKLDDSLSVRLVQEGDPLLEFIPEWEWSSSTNPARSNFDWCMQFTFHSYPRHYCTSFCKYNGCPPKSEVDLHKELARYFPWLSSFGIFLSNFLEDSSHRTVYFLSRRDKLTSCMLFFNGVREVLCDYRVSFFRVTPKTRSRLWSSYFGNLSRLAGLFDRSEAKFVKLIKSWCAWAAAYALQQSELPKDFQQILSGPLLRLIKRLLRTGSSLRRTQLGWSLSQVKRACAPINAAFISEISRSC